METQADTPPTSGRRRAPASPSLRWAALAGALAIAGMIGVGATQADAQDVGGLQAKIESARADARDLAASIEDGAGAVTAAREHAVSASTEEARLTGLLSAGREREAALTTDAEAAERRLAQARERLARARKALADRLVAIYKGATVDETSLLLDASGYDDLTTRADFLRRIEQADQSLASRVAALRTAVARQLAAVEQARDAQAAHNAEVADARDRFAAARAEAEARAAALDAARNEQAAALTSLRSQVGEWTAQVQEAEAASAAEAQETVAGWVGEWAIPAGIVMCESGGNYQALNPGSGAGGAYQILPSTWAAYGGHGSPHTASPAEQDRIAAQIWADSGGSAWVCAG